MDEAAVRQRARRLATTGPTGVAFGVARSGVERLHDLVWQGLDGVDHRSRRMLTAAGGPGSVLIRRTHPGGWPLAGAMAVLALGFASQTQQLAHLVSGGSADPIAGRGWLVLGVLLLASDLLLRLGAEPAVAVAVGRAGVALGLPATATDQRSSPLGSGLRRAGRIDVDLVRWSAVDAVVLARWTTPDGPDCAALGVRLRRPLETAWPHPDDHGAFPRHLDTAPLGTRLLTRPVRVLGGRRLRDLTEAVERLAPGTPVEDGPLVDILRRRSGWRS